MRTLLNALAILFAIVWLPAASCDVKPVNPGPAVVGGATSTGGAPSVGGASQVQSKCLLACANLEALGCPEEQSSCARLCELHATDSRFSQGLDCRIDAKTKADAQKCGPASCKEWR